MGFDVYKSGYLVTCPGMEARGLCSSLKECGECPCQGDDDERRNEMEPLLPPDVQAKLDHRMKEEEKESLERLQALADKKGMLLPTQFNRRPETSTQSTKHGHRGIEPLLPCGFGR